MTKRFVETPENFFDMLGGITGGQRVTIGYVSGAHLTNIPKGTFINPKTKRKNSFDDYEAFGKTFGAENIAGVIKLTSYNLSWRNPESVKKNYADYVEKANAIRAQHGLDPIGKGGYTRTSNFANGGVSLYSGKNDDVMGNSYTPQNVFGAVKKSVYYLIDKEGHIVKSVSLEELKPYLKGASPVDGVGALRKMGKESEEIEAYCKELAALKMSYRNFEHKSILYMVATVDGVPTIYLNNKMTRNINDTVQVDTGDFLKIAKERYAKDLAEVEHEGAKPVSLNENDLKNLIKEAVKKILSEGRYNPDSVYVVCDGSSYYGVYGCDVEDEIRDNDVEVVEGPFRVWDDTVDQIIDDYNDEMNGVDYRIDETHIQKMVSESLKKVLNEISPKLLQHAADIADKKGRYSQRDNFEKGGDERAENAFSKRPDIRVSARVFTYRTESGSYASISRDGGYYFKTASGYNNEQGNLKAFKRFPEYMSVNDKSLARLIEKWWKEYGEVDIPCMNDWHNFVNYSAN